MNQGANSPDFGRLRYCHGKARLAGPFCCARHHPIVACADVTLPIRQLAGRSALTAGGSQGGREGTFGALRGSVLHDETRTVMRASSARPRGFEP
jgi:hypothetical protein